ncbi:CU044_5270 family protein [Actinoallomurus purpureus]|uniref:CU044_5270 family protein n=1 Tax=Actinoallomurus purpureus TaxID=478114 RepID=UPI002092DE40|nr:CU044_5270 family protein [Actinoallomurus purpureus]MCO6007613.1 CU044_5270 family protein [Actinoallomurus purpureus]
MKQNELDSMINALKPAVVDELAGAAYERRPDTSLVRARAGTATVRRGLAPGRRPVRRLAFATGATAVVAATAVLATGVLSGGHDGGTAGNGATGQPGAINTRTFLLASAETAAKQPATHGTCWYSRTRTWDDHLVPLEQPSPHDSPTPQNSPVPRNSPTPRNSPVPQSKHQIPQVKPQTFQARGASSDESWACTVPGGTGMRFRSRLPLNVQVTFPTKKDEAAWRAAGSAPLNVNGFTTASKPRTTTYHDGSHSVNPDIGRHEIEWKTIPKLPTTKSGLEGYLQRLWQEDTKGRADFGKYVFVSASDLLRTPTTPGTRAALYRILADSPSVRVTGRITDREGRSGVAISAHVTDGVDTRLVVDPVTAQLLDYEVPGTGTRKNSPDEYIAYENQGWVNKIGAVPAS